MEPELNAQLPPNAAFVISVAARLVGVHEQTLRYYERAGLVEPARSKGRIRLYSLHDLERVRQIRRLTDEMGVNLAGVEVIMRLTDRIREHLPTVPIEVAPYGVADFGMMVAADARGRGVGSALLATAIEWARAAA